MGNLCGDPTLRQHVASNKEGILEEVILHLRTDVEGKPAFWTETVTRELAVLINVSIEGTAQTYLISEVGVFAQLETLITTVLYKDEPEVVSRVLNLLSKLSRDIKAAQAIAESKNILLKILLYFNKGAFP